MVENCKARAEAMLERCRWAFVALFLAWAATVHAQLDLDRLQRLVEQGRMEQAYQLARDHRAELEGRTRFDFYYGVAAIEAGHVAEGVFALERVLMRQPGHDRARLELARGYFLLGEDPRAREAFRTVMAQAPPESVKATIDRFLEAIRRRSDRYETVATAYVDLAGGWDSNVNSATEADSVALFDGLFELNLSDSSQAREDAFWQLSGGAEVRRPLSPTTGVFGAFDFRVRGHAEESDFNTGRFSYQGGWEWRGDFSRLRLAGRLQPFLLDGDVYQNRYGASAEYRYAFAETTAGTAFARMDWIDYPDQGIRDSRLWTAGLGGDHLFRGPYRPALSLKAFGGGEVADADSDRARAIAERDIYGARLSLGFILHPEWRVDLGGQVRRSDYDAEHQLFLEAREETYYRAEMGVDWQPTRHWRVGPQVRYTANDANLTVYDYERTRAWLRLRYEHF
ncbi:tetratricopeptide repeat protein [Thiohalorhabdus sp.]|uniref:tetratricopeptide repeat protein n=1 Tax=Thiohalorhabdus sp. TaxID=3094134 RepID=UPI002FC37DF4